MFPLWPFDSGVLIMGLLNVRAQPDSRVWRSPVLHLTFRIMIVLQNDTCETG